MKKTVILPLLLAVVASLTSCKKESSNVYGWIQLASITSENHDTNSQNITAFKYAEYDKKGNKKVVDGSVISSLPVICQQTQSNSDTTLIEYAYSSKGDTLTVDFTMKDKSKSREVYLLNDLNMADRKVVDGKDVVLENIKYDTYGYRTNYNDNVLKSSMRNYTSVNRDDKLTATFKMANLENVIGLQQFGVPGDEYLNYCDNFGEQNSALLAGITTTEDAELCYYSFMYEFNTHKCITKEVITRNGKTYITNTYTYEYFSIQKD